MASPYQTLNCITGRLIYTFTPSLNDFVFSTWKEERYLWCRGPIHHKRNFASFAQLRAAYNIPVSSFFSYLQIWDYVRIQMPNFENLDEHESLQAMNRFDPNIRRAVSFFYQIMHDSSLINTTKVKQAWMEEDGWGLGRIFMECTRLFCSCQTQSYTV